MRGKGCHGWTRIVSLAAVSVPFRDHPWLTVEELIQGLGAEDTFRPAFQRHQVGLLNALPMLLRGLGAEL